MTTREVIESYLECVRAKRGWEALLSDDVEFTNFTHPVKRAKGKSASLPGIARFYSMVQRFEVGDVIVAENRASAMIRYELTAPDGRRFESHIAEVFEVADGQIVSFGIYFDSAPYPKPPQPNN